MIIDIVHFPFLDGDYGEYISQHKKFVVVCVVT